MLDLLSPIHPASAEPPALQVYKALTRAMTDASLPSGARLPPERLVAERLGVSRVTLRRALAALQADGLVRATQGSGWYLTEGFVEESHDELQSFTDLARSRGLRASARVLASEVRASTIEEADQLGIAPGAPVLHLQRLRYLDDVAVAISTSQVPATIAESFGDVDFSDASLFEALRTRAHVVPASSDYVLQARGATEYEGALLELPVGAPVLHGVDAVFDERGRVLAIGTTVYRGDRYRFRTTLTSKAPRRPKPND